MKDRPILFSVPMVRAILDGRKTQTRRMVKFPIKDRNGSGCEIAGNELNSMLGQELEIGAGSYLCPYGQPGDRLWVRETFGLWCHSFESVGVEYAAGGEDKIVDFPNKVGMPTLEEQCRKNAGGGRRKRSSIFMPRWASRITLEIVSVRVERLNAITEEDAEAEGALIGFGEHPEPPAATAQYRRIWEQINGKGSWDQNHWVWVIEFNTLTA